MINALGLFSLQNRVAVITGATSGIGKCVAEHFASAGADVTVISRHLKESKTVAEYLHNTYGVNTLGIECDVSDEECVRNTFAKIREFFGHIDILVNNAGYNINGGALDLNYSDWQGMMNVNVNGVFLCAREAGRYFVNDGINGSIVNIASISSHIVNLPQWQTAYNTSKAAVRHLTKTLAIEWASKGIRVNSVSPGYVWTEMNQKVPESITHVWMEATPFHRFASPDEIASAVLYLASPAASYTTGSDLIVDGGFTCL